MSYSGKNFQGNSPNAPPRKSSAIADRDAVELNPRNPWFSFSFVSRLLPSTRPLPRGHTGQVARPTSLHSVFFRSCHLNPSTAHHLNPLYIRFIRVIRGAVSSFSIPFSAFQFFSVCFEHPCHPRNPQFVGNSDAAVRQPILREHS